MPSAAINSVELPTYLATITSRLPTYAQQWHDLPLSALSIPTAAHIPNIDTFAAGPALEAARPATHIPMSALSQPRTTNIAPIQAAPTASSSGCLSVAASCLSGTAVGVSVLVILAVFPGSIIAGGVLIVESVLKADHTLLKAGLPLLTLGACVGAVLNKDKLLPPARSF